MNKAYFRRITKNNQEINEFYDKMRKKTEIEYQKIENRVDSIESVLKTLDSDVDRLSLERKNVIREMRALEKIKDDLTELEKWKGRALERINNQDTRLDDRLRELKNLEERVEKTMKDQRSYFEEGIFRIDSKLKKFEDFENRATTFMNEIVEEYEKRFEILRREIKMTPYGFPTIKEKPWKFLSKIKKTIFNKKQRIAELEKKVKEQHKLIKKMMDDLEDLTKSDSKTDKT